jgi:hypothetical protein
MKNRFGVLSVFLTLALVFVFVSSGMADVGQKRLKRTETHKYTLYPAPGGNDDPYSVRFPITIEEPGLITVDVEVGGGQIKGGGSPFMVWIVQTAGVNDEKTNKIQNKYIKKKEKFKTKESINYAVDAGELARTKGEYMIFLSNLSKGSHAVGTIIITYPAQSKERHKRDEK